jgi:hypothetical protein
MPLDSFSSTFGAAFAKLPVCYETRWVESDKLSGATSKYVSCCLLKHFSEENL